MSYKPRGIYDYYGGWTGTIGRIYGCCSEPSFYASLLCIDFAILWKAPKKNKYLYITLFLIVLNIFMTDARSGYGIFACIIMSIFASFLLRQEIFYIKAIHVIIIFIPILAYAIINYLVTAGKYRDLSALSRLYSAQYYIKEVFQNPIIMLFGHGLGYSWQIDLSRERYIEAVAHNGYIELMYLLGIPFLIFIILGIFNLSKKIKSEEMRTIFLTTAVSMFMFGSYYNIESNIEFFFVLFALFTINRNKILITSQKK